MSAEPHANLSFLPWVRQGAASAIATVDTLGANQSGVVDLTAGLSVNNGSALTVPVRLRGPADVVGIDANQVLRTDPRPGSNDFEPNCFASIEFDRADFPWLFTPARADANSRLRPWLCLVVVRKQDGVTLSSTVDAPLVTLQIAAPAKPADELPDLRECWAWSHAQAAAADTSLDAVANALAGAPELSLSRLLCPRLLAPNTDYIACVVPTFELGRKAGLGLPIVDSDLIALNALASAWTLAPAAPAQVRLPVYYHWEFRTGVGGDFSSLANLLRARAVPAGLGRRPINISQPGFAFVAPAGSPPITQVELEAALEPLEVGEPQAPWSGPIALSFQKALAPIVNEPSRSLAVDPKADPLLAPPIYGRWHAGRATVTPAGATWLDQLNLDPRWRVAAAFGTRVIQEHQDALIASAWEQAAELQHVNQRMRQFQLSLAVGESLHTRHFNTQAMTEEMVLRVAAPVFGRIRQASGHTLLAQQAGSALPVPANRSAMRRIGRLRGPLTRRVAAQGFARLPTQTWVAQLNRGENFPAAPPRPGPDFCALPSLPVTDIADHSNYGAFTVWPERALVPSPGAPIPIKPADTDFPGFFRKAAIEHLERFFPPHPIPITAHHIIFQDTKQLVLAQIHPRLALAALVRAVVSTGDNVLAPTAPGVTPVGVEAVMAAPSFPQPMYEPLRDLSQDLLLPGLDKVVPDTVLGLKTNRRFVEAYMVGLNHEMGRELLWRGYPTDQRGTYFHHFWGLGVPNASPADIKDLNTWHDRPLGDLATGAPVGDEFVMLMRSRLLRRYPNAVIYLMPANDPTQVLPPIFCGSMQPDVSFFGFAVTSGAATGKSGGPGYYVVIQEHPTEPRFGLDVGISLGNASHLSIGANPPAGVPLKGYTWGRNAAHMGGITRRVPVRVAIHASRLLTPA